MNRIVIISGPSGAGEDSIISGIEKKIRIERVRTTTTRDLRPGESQGNPYYFITKEEFERKLEKGDFVEHALQYNGNLYGVTREELERVENSGRVGIWKIEYKGVISAKNIFPEIKSILINTPNLETLESRIRRRDNPPEEYIRQRMEYTKEWLRHRKAYDFEVINVEGKLDKAIQEVSDIIRKILNV